MLTELSVRAARAVEDDLVLSVVIAINKVLLPAARAAFELAPLSTQTSLRRVTREMMAATATAR